MVQNAPGDTRDNSRTVIPASAPAMPGFSFCRRTIVTAVLRACQSPAGKPQSGAPQGPTAAELLGRSGARTFGEKAGVVAYWLEEHGGRNEWRSGDIVDVLKGAGEAVPANITDALNQKLRKGLFEVTDRRWRLTGEGRGWVKYSLLDLRADA